MHPAAEDYRMTVETYISEYDRGGDHYGLNPSRRYPDDRGDRDLWGEIDPEIEPEIDPDVLDDYHPHRFRAFESRGTYR